MPRGIPLGLTLGSSFAVDSLNPDYSRNCLPNICPCNMPAAEVIFHGEMGRKRSTGRKKIEVSYITGNSQPLASDVKGSWDFELMCLIQLPFGNIHQVSPYRPRCQGEVLSQAYLISGREG